MQTHFHPPDKKNRKLKVFYKTFSEYHLSFEDLQIKQIGLIVLISFISSLAVEAKLYIKKLRVLKNDGGKLHFNT